MGFFQVPTMEERMKLAKFRKEVCMKPKEMLFILILIRQKMKLV
jgi:hypothetical protein